MLQLKRFESAEILLRARQALSEFTMVVEYLRSLNVDGIMKHGNDPKVCEFIEALISPIDIDSKLKAYGLLDRTLPRLYLSENTLSFFEVYENIILHAVTIMKILSIPLNKKADLIKKDTLINKVIEVAPISKDGFDKYGEGYAFLWCKYFHDETLKALRNELSDVDNMSKDTELAMRLALDTRQASLDIRLALQKAGLSENLIKERFQSGN